MQQPKTHALRLDLPTWQHVRRFCDDKIKNESYLGIIVPFDANKGDSVHLKIIFPNREQTTVKAEVVSAMPGLGGRSVLLKSIRFSELNEELEVQLEKQGKARAPVEQILTPAPLDAPVHEEIEVVGDFALDDIVDELQPTFFELSEHLNQFQAMAAHQCLGVSKNAVRSEILLGHARMLNKFHPDKYSFYQSERLSELALELSIHVNRACDRILLALENETPKRTKDRSTDLEREGWFLALEDMSTFYTPLPFWSVDSEKLFGDDDITPDPEGNEVGTTSASLSSLATIKQKFKLGQYEKAKAELTELLIEQPRLKEAQALHHVACGQILMKEGKNTLAMSHFEAALSHDPNCQEARETILLLRARRSRPTTLTKNIFKR